MHRKSPLRNKNVSALRSLHYVILFGDKEVSCRKALQNNLISLIQTLIVFFLNWLRYLLQITYLFSAPFVLIGMVFNY